MRSGLIGCLKFRNLENMFIWFFLFVRVEGLFIFFFYFVQCCKIIVDLEDYDVYFVDDVQEQDFQ